MRWATGIVILVCVLASVGVAQHLDRIPIPGGVFYYQPASAVFGSEATWINPAGLGRYSSNGAQLMADYFDEQFAKSWGWLATGKELSIAWRKVDRPDGDIKQWIFAGGLPLGRSLAIGASYWYFPSGPELYNNRHFWNIGIQEQGSGPLAFGAVFSNLNRAKVGGERTEVEMRYSLAYRTLREKLTVAADMMLSTGTRFNNADWIYHAEFTPITGLFLNGSIDSDRNFQIGLRLNLTQHFFGSKGGFNKHGNHRGTTTFIGTTELRQPSVIKPPQRRLSIDVSNQAENPARPILGRRPTPFSETLFSIYRAAEDPYIKDIVLKLDGSPGFGRSQELRDALLFFKSTGKRIFSHINSPSNLTYYIASVSDSIYIPLVSQMNLVGLRAELTFYAGTLDKLGIKIDMLRIGDYKSAAEAYTRTAATEENRAQVNRLLDELYGQLVEGIAEARRMTPDSVRAIIDRGPLTSVEAKEFGLVDGLSYRDDLDERIGRTRSLSISRYRRDTLENYSWYRKPVLAIIVAEGDITSDGGDISPLGQAGGVTPTPIKRGFERVQKDRDIRGVIFRVNSPGGSALASDDIFHYAEKASRKKPVVVSMANTAASGGYYIAMPAHRVFANPATVTGSIGIFGGKADFSTFYQKIALGKELYTRGRFAGMMSTMAPFTEEEREKYFSQLQAFYGHFLDLVSHNRRLPVDSVDNLGRGRVWTGREALSNGLVDQIGGLKQAVAYVAEQIGATDYRIRLYPENRPLFIMPRPAFLASLAGLFTKHQSPSEELAAVLAPWAEPQMLTRLPYDLDIQ